ncbi:isochorismatase family protein (plasmid) [Streptosporangium sp. NBC_01495]|uniref:isochorismatase family protein n=1 Tax=Streptosporangium sp. NBC_01495 TaxID=2903899 RepID=UPI002E327A5E|nr:isochorismatase family protein [Streptosporangium sp. NBC_01495]
MALPRISPYAIPTDLPPARVRWTLRAQRSVLLIHDVQNYFLAPFIAGKSPIPEMIMKIARLRERCVHMGIPVIYTAQPGGQSPEDRGLLADMWGPGLRADPADSAVTAALTPGPNDIVIRKGRYSAFQGTDLAAKLTEYDGDQLIICGVYAHIGVLATALDAFQRDIQTFVIADAIADFSHEDHQRAIDYMARLCAVPLTADQALKALGTPSPSPLTVVR